MMLPAVVLLFIYAYVPMFGILIAFEKFDITKGVIGFFTSKWVGMANFIRIFNMDGFKQALFNTINIAWWKMVAMFFVPLIASLLLNEIRQEGYKRSIQTIIYLPHFLSWVILAGILKNVLDLDGILNNTLHSLFGIKPIMFLGEPKIFPSVLVWTQVWQEFGWSTIIFLAAITGIDPALYEAAIVDGANRLQQTWHVTLPGMRSILVLCAVLSLGGILNAGFDQVFNLYSVPVYKTGDIIDTLVYRTGIANGQFEIATAVGLFKSVVSLIMVSLSYFLAYKLADYQIF
ncbi:MAG: ABC transporter permease subunit [Clostridiales bacterium]|nr:ABC transporter permease subunit [Clostridiales bacterium]